MKTLNFRKGMLCVGLLVLCLAGCGQEKTAAEGDFSFQLPEGYAIADVTERSCSIVDAGGTAVGGFVLTDMTREDLTDDDSNGVILYLESIAEGSEYFAWKGEDPEHPMRYVTHYAPVPDTQERKTYSRVLFIKGGGVYDMWFDLDVIDGDLVSSFYPAVEGG